VLYDIQRGDVIIFPPPELPEGPDQARHRSSGRPRKDQGRHRDHSTAGSSTNRTLRSPTFHYHEEKEEVVPPRGSITYSATIGPTVRTARFPLDRHTPHQGQGDPPVVAGEEHGVVLASPDSRLLTPSPEHLDRQTTSDILDLINWSRFPTKADSSGSAGCAGSKSIGENVEPHGTS
jgi:hypothetical protein